MAHGLELFFPELDFGLDGLPLGGLDFAHYVALDDDLLVPLVDFGVDDLVLDRFNRPLFDAVLVNVQQLGQLAVFEIGCLSRQSADLKIRLLVDGLLNRDLLCRHHLLILLDLSLEILSVSLDKQ